MPRNILDEKFKLARNTLLQFIEQDITKENTTDEGTAKWKSIEENTKSRNFKGEVIVYEMPSSAHTYVAGYLIVLIGAWSNYLDVGPELDITVNRNTQYISDVVVEPWPPRQPGQQPASRSVSRPRMIIEVGRHEPIGSLHSLSKDYFSDSAQTRLIQFYLSIKIFDLRSDNTAAMLAMLYLRNNQIPTTIPTQNLPNVRMTTMQNTIPNLVISFGTAPLQHESIDIINSTGIRSYRITGFLHPNDTACTNPGMLNYQINIPSNLLFNSFPGGVLQGTPNNST
ncbi:11806_t:CDS:2 [Funneliformis mosseae]|uniref:11806_t:CDS:1 n=1 Tax=Funneliformis mosseae TaxID=27381 RepID=A0A9N8VRI9_FUNMO|nr:11806_t:CDS:2 [Funneliformis mosseae]